MRVYQIWRSSKRIEENTNALGVQTPLHLVLTPLIVYLQGMVYLSRSPLKSHGSLRTSNCLIDNRWVLKISGFGLARFREGARDQETSDSKKCQKLLYVAPELLRIPERTRPVCGSLEGDVYSFGIIMQELIYRTAPYFDVLEPTGDVIR